MAKLKKDFLYLCFLNQLAFSQPGPNMDSGIVILPVITLLEDFTLFGS